MSKSRSSISPLPNERLKQERLSRGWTQVDVAGFIGTDGYTINRWERGKAKPRPYFCLKLCELFSKSALDLGLLPEPAECTAVTKPTPVERQPISYWRIPNRNPFFTEQGAFLETLHTYMSMESGQPYALYGLGGIGKTQLAIEYAHRYAVAYQAVFWVNASNLEQIVASYRSIAEFLQCSEGSETDEQQIVVAVYRWLTTYEKWLLIWDDLEDPELLQRFLPPMHRGAVLITTRKPALGRFAFPVEVPLMTPEEGSWLLLKRARVLHTSMLEEHRHQFTAQHAKTYAAARELAITLGRLPLALDQAGSYIEETECSVSDYMQRYQQHRIRLLERRGAAGGDHPYSVETTFKRSYQRVLQEQPLAAYILCLCVFLYEEGIPEELFEADATLLGLACDLFVDNLFVTTPYQLDQAIATLRNFSLVKRYPETKMLSIHPLVKAVLQDAMSGQERAQWQRCVIKLLNNRFGEVNPQASGQYERFLPHVLTYLTSSFYQIFDQDVVRLLQKAVDYFDVHAQYEQRELLYQRMQSIWEQMMGAELFLNTGLDVCTARNVVFPVLE